MGVILTLGEVRSLMMSNKNEHKKIDYKEFLDCVFSIGLKASHALREKLEVDENVFRNRPPYSHENTRNIYIYRTLDEAQKALLCFPRWKEFFTDESVTLETDIQRHMMRITEQSVHDEISLRCRKLAEALLDTLLFQNTNDNRYFKDYFYFHELCEWQKQQKDRQEFYGFTSKNADYFMQTIRQGIHKLEIEGFEIDKRWYLDTAKPIAKIKNVRLAGFLSKYKKVTAQGPEVTLLLARSYSQAYGDSEIVHFSPLDVSPSYTVRESEIKAMRAAILSIHLIATLQNLSLLSLKDGNVLSELRPKIYSYSHYDQLTHSIASAGEYVFVRGNLCQVIEERRSKYGYFCYHVRYIDTPPIPDITDDWFASFEIQRLGNMDELLERVKSVYQKHNIELSHGSFNPIDKESFEQALVRSVHETIAFLRNQGGTSK